MKPRLRYGSKIEEWHKKDLSAAGQAPVAGGNSKHNIFIHEIRIIEHFEL